MWSHIVNISNMQHARYKEMVSNIITLRYDIYISIYPACLQCLAPGTHTLCAVHRLDQAPEVPLQCLCLPQLGVVHPRMQHDWSNVLFALQDRGYLRRNIGNTSTRETAWMCPHLHSKLDINPPLKQVTVKLCSVDQTITVQRGSVLDVRIQSDFSSPFAHSGWVQFLESGEGCTNGSLSSQIW